MAKEREPAKHLPSASNRIKSIWKKSRSRNEVSLREFVRNSKDEEVQDLALNWFHNKTANTSKPPQGIGSTKKRKNSQPKKAAA